MQNVKKKLGLHNVDLALDLPDQINALYFAIDCVKEGDYSQLESAQKRLDKITIDIEAHLLLVQSVINKLREAAVADLKSHTGKQ